MIVKMKEYYQDAKHSLIKDAECEVDAKLGEWLIANRKAVIVVKHLEVEPQFEQAEEPPHYGAQAEPELRQDENKYPEFRKPRRGRGGAK